jgi:CDGSH-type Zn-finger protein
MADDVRIKIVAGGPYMVSGAVPLYQGVLEPEDGGGGATESWKRGKDYDTGGRGTFALCRCGRSATKPFCDGTHVHIGFDRSETASRLPYLECVKVYPGDGLDLLDRKDVCAYARFCDRGINTWHKVLRTSPDHPEYRPEYEEDSIKEAGLCPSGRLTIRRDGELIEPDLPKEIKVTEDPLRKCKGPLAVTGGITLISADGTEYELRNRYTLCRCGESKNLPFCDGTHFDCEQMRGLDK